MNEIYNLLKNLGHHLLLAPTYDKNVFDKAINKFIFDYQRVYPNSTKIDIEKIQLFPSLYAILTYRIAREYFLINQEDKAIIYSLIGRHYSGVEIFYSANIGKALKINHGLGTVIGARSVIGNNCTLHQNVTLGDYKEGRPTLGNNVMVYAGAVVIGNIILGDNTIVGANAIVSKNVKSGATVVACNKYI